MTMPNPKLTPAQIRESRAICEKATPGPWFTSYAAVHSEPLFKEYNRIEKTIPDDAPEEAYKVLPDTDVCHVPVVGGDTPTAQGAKDATFIALARTALPAALDEIERLRGLVREACDIAEFRRSAPLTDTAQITAVDIRIAELRKEAE